MLYQEVLTRITFADPDGTEHEFVEASRGGGPSAYSATDRGSNFPGEFSCLPDASKSNLGRVWVTRDGTFMTLLLQGGLTEYGTAPSAGSDPSVTGALTGFLYKKDGTRYEMKGTLPTTYGAGLEYSEHGAPKAAQWGTGLAEARSFNTRLQPCQIQVTNRLSQAVLAGFDLYDGSEAGACGARVLTGTRHRDWKPDAAKMRSATPEWRPGDIAGGDYW